MDKKENEKKGQVYTIVGQAYCGEGSEACAFVVTVERPLYAQICRMRKIAEDNQLTDVRISDYRVVYSRLDVPDLRKAVIAGEATYDDVPTVNQDSAELSVGPLGFQWTGYEKHTDDELGTPTESFNSPTWKAIVRLFEGTAAQEAPKPARRTFVIDCTPDDTHNNQDGMYTTTLRVESAAGPAEFENDWESAVEAVKEETANEYEFDDVLERVKKTEGRDYVIAYVPEADRKVTY